MRNSDEARRTTPADGVSHVVEAALRPHVGSGDVRRMTWHLRSAGHVRLRPGPDGRRRHGWDGGLGPRWFNDPARDLVAIWLTNQMWTSPAPLAVFDAFAEAAART